VRVFRDNMQLFVTLYRNHHNMAIIYKTKRFFDMYVYAFLTGQPQNAFCATHT